ncbi:hypothetical protein NEQG_01248 [Nematocida parisii ERTm3]|uniref:Rhodanese domain-containing protein n=1 Tax=Nematocida parisii (strain ERTm3) TaxID=935791 RepID=I3EH61_NEMP3|nr:hypothetical protein NEQG_01248 [Nematocida parisii ERTm3]
MKIAEREGAEREEKEESEQTEVECIPRITTNKVQTSSTKEEIMVEKIYAVNNNKSTESEENINESNNTSSREERPMALSYIDRYSRQMIIKEIGVEGQKKIKESRVLVVGAGGLGAPVLMYLSAMGVGTIGISDSDVVEESNLNRQVLYKELSIGKYKTKEAKDNLSGLSSSAEYNIHNKITRENLWSVCSLYDLVLDCGDNRPLRYLLSDYCRSRSIPYICGSSLRWEGHVYRLTTLCYRCVHPTTGMYTSGNCSSAGIIGSMCGVVGSLMATEAMKVIIGLEGMDDRLTYINGLKNEFMNLSLKKKLCTLCRDTSLLTVEQKKERIFQENQDLEEKDEKFSQCELTDLIKKATEIKITKNTEIPENTSKSTIEQTDHKTASKDVSEDILTNSKSADEIDESTEIAWKTVYSSPESYFIVDIRSSAENKIISVPKAYLYPLSEIVDNPKKARTIIQRKAKNRRILLCCRNGSTSKKFVPIFGGLSISGGTQSYIKYIQSLLNKGNISE